MNDIFAQNENYTAPSQPAAPPLLAMEIRGMRNIVFTEAIIEAGKVNRIEGVNGSGKSSIIDALFIAINGLQYMKHRRWKEYDTNQIINHDADKIEIKIKIASGVKRFSVKRTIARTADRGADIRELVITSQDGTITTRDVKDMFNLISIDIMDFLDLSSKEKLEYLQRLVDPDKLEAIQKKEQAIKEIIAVHNREKRQVDDAIRIAEENGENVAVQAPSIEAEQEQEDILHAKKIELEKKRTEHADHERRINQCRNDYTEKQTDIKALQEKLALRQTELQEIEERGARLKSEHSDIDFDKIAEDIRDIDDKLAAAKERMKQREKILEAKGKYEAYLVNVKKKQDCMNYIAKDNEDMAAIRKAKAELFKECGINAEIDYTDDRGLVIDGAVFSDMSSGEQIKKIAQVIDGTYQEQHIKLCIVRNASLLDSESLAALKSVANEHNITFICEIVSENNEVIISQE